MAQRFDSSPARGNAVSLMGAAVNPAKLRIVARAAPAMLASVMALALFSGCGRKDKTAPAFDATDYEVKGVLREVREEGWRALIAHEEIPDYMEPMTMEFAVKDTNELRGLLPGDQLKFRLLVTDDDAWIDQVQRLGSDGQPVASTPAALSPELEPGAPLPDATLTNQFGQPFQLAEGKGRALAFTFIFTRCPLPTFCPRLNKHFYEVQQALSEPGMASNWHLLSISFDPEWDTPERLAAYGPSQGQDPAHWTFATAAIPEIRRLAGSFGLTFAREGGSFNHNVRTVVVDAAGRVQRIFTNNDWQAGDLVAEMKKAMEAQP
jgi:protein SCO1/2